MEIAILLAWDAAGATLLARTPAGPAHRVRLGKMWAQPDGAGWKLLDKLSPAWEPPQALSPTSSP